MRGADESTVIMVANRSGTDGINVSVSTMSESVGKL